ncbi:MAG: DUF4312 family protein [Yersiniaceae bacterium]|uniref:Cytoplasmic protein n=1 Tax=Chimaeribacter coloradensis TaxID=2060068 RepID=A0A2N5E8S7_9GAMM|nr:DUF4312 family protein [Chimaeribacter coloradensis]MDU6409582.1 DUF4312 family protein [Yersiniaceae bacterium]PLR38308.1 cytoplasmic protein [Chimaeribacter coloradensis]
MKQHYTTTVQVQGKGETKAAAFSAALSQVQQAVMRSTENILLRIEPQDLRVIKAEEKITREKFLFFFLPREKRHYQVLLEITVNVTAINTGQVTFATL